MQEGKERVDRAKAKLQEDEASLTLFTGELEGVTRQVEAHKAETVRLATEAAARRVEEVGSDMEVEGGTDTGEEVGVNIEAGKKRKVVRKARPSASAGSLNLTTEDLMRAFARLSEQDKERCRTVLVHEAGVGSKTDEVFAKASGSREDKVEFNSRVASVTYPGGRG